MQASRSHRLVRVGMCSGFYLCWGMYSTFPRSLEPSYHCAPVQRFPHHVTGRPRSVSASYGHLMYPFYFGLVAVGFCDVGKHIANQDHLEVECVTGGNSKLNLSLCVRLCKFRTSEMHPFCQIGLRYHKPVKSRRAGWIANVVLSSVGAFVFLICIIVGSINASRG